MKYHILVFDSTHRVMKAEKILISKGFKIDIIATPKEITSDCGMSIRFENNPSVLETITGILSVENIPFTVHEKNSQ